MNIADLDIKYYFQFKMITFQARKSDEEQTKVIFNVSAKLLSNCLGDETLIVSLFNYL
jgi:hypothetical protein